ncbi:DUF2478 domain-containing protein [Methylobacterium oryzae]
MKSILALTGGTSLAIQALLSDSARRWRDAGLRVVGAVEVPSPDGSGHRLVDVATGGSYEIHQRLGSGSTSCSLCASGIVEACEDINRQILAGCDVVVLSKFGKLEAARSGLVQAFSAAVSEDIPILTAVAPTFADAWETFSGNLSAFAAPDPDAIEAWRLALRGSLAGTPTPDLRRIAGGLR